MNTDLLATPYVLKQFDGGYSMLRIQDLMFAKREIECTGAIDREMTYSLCQQLRYLSKEDPEKAISIYINSPGGEVSAGLAIYDVMKAISCPIRTVCVGTAASMAALLFIAGDTREMLSHAKVMIHDPLIRETGGSALVLKNIADDIMQTRETTGQIIAKHTGHTLEEVFEMTARDSYFDAEAAVAWGIADNIIEKL